jgi:hypothetical protein
MTSKPTDIGVPAGFRWWLSDRTLIIECLECHRRWNGARIQTQANQVWLRDHADEHRHVNRQVELEAAELVSDE